MKIVPNIIKKIFDKKFYDVVDDYAAYHKKVDTFSENRAKLFLNIIEKNNSILDVGCGDGKVAKYLIDNKNCVVEGIDISNRAKKQGISVNIQDINKQIKINKTYDYILLSEVIEHLQFPQNILKTAIKHSKNGLIISIPNSGWFVWRFQLLLGNFPRQSFTHLHFWTHKDFNLFLNEIRLKVKDQYFLSNFKKSVAFDFLANLWPNLFAHQLIYVVEKKK